MSKHTPGPWEIDEDGGIYARSQTIVIGQVYDSSDYPCLDGNEAEVDAEAADNAKLIAAAPELLAALGEVLPLIKYTDDAGWDKVKRARIAYEKATK